MTAPLIFDVSLEDYEERVIQASYHQPILVDLWAEWCPPCLVVAPVLEQVVKERGGAISLAKVDVDDGDNMKIAGRYQVRGFPTILLIQNGGEKGRFYSAQTKSFVQAFIDKTLLAP